MFDNLYVPQDFNALDVDNNGWLGNDEVVQMLRSQEFASERGPELRGPISGLSCSSIR